MRQKGGFVQWLLMKELLKQKGGSKRINKNKKTFKKKYKRGKIKQKGGQMVRQPHPDKFNPGCSIM